MRLLYYAQQACGRKFFPLYCVTSVCVCARLLLSGALRFENWEFSILLLALLVRELFFPLPENCTIMGFR